MPGCTFKMTQAKKFYMIVLEKVKKVKIKLNKRKIKLTMIKLMTMN